MSEVRRRPEKSTDKPAFRMGDEIGDYIVNGFAGRGATSHVYRAHHYASKDPVAIKILHPKLVHDQIKRARFLREAQMMIQMNHPNVVYFHEIFDMNGQLAFVMEYIDGMQLDQWLKAYESELDELTITCLFMDILRGLNHAHEHGIYHRDLKPANIMVSKEKNRWIAKIIDFGVARIADEPIPEEDRDKIVGTAAYISPEEIRDPRTVCPSSDIYSIGVMLYEALCGRRPFEGMGVSELMTAHVKLDPERPRAVNPNISSPFEALLLRSLTKRPQDRFESAEDLMIALESIARMVDAQEVHNQVSTQNMPVQNYDPEANILTEIWERPQQDKDLFFFFKNFLALAFSIVLNQSRKKEEKPKNRKWILGGEKETTEEFPPSI